MMSGAGVTTTTVSGAAATCALETYTVRCEVHAVTSISPPKLRMAFQILLNIYYLQY